MRSHSPIHGVTFIRDIGDSGDSGDSGDNVLVCNGGAKSTSTSGA
jgi:hypothetical protein